jgi:hypothetical protein
MDSATPRIELAIQEIESKLAGVHGRLEGNRELLTGKGRLNRLPVGRVPQAGAPAEVGNGLAAAELLGRLVPEPNHAG